jgi:hypothetical protein
MKRLLLFALVLLLAVSFALPAYQAEAATRKVVKIGDITTFNGAVLVRTKGTWGRLKKTPHPLFSSDKIVTKRGRAHVKFVDGGSMRVNIDSNVSIVQRIEMKGFFTKKAVTSREINVLVGDVWFDVKVTKQRRMTFRTPSMTAAIRGTQGTVGSDINGLSSFGLSQGSAGTSGDFRKIPAPRVLRPSLRMLDMPRSNLAVQKMPLMKAADKAVLAHANALKKASLAGAKNKAAKMAGSQATPSNAASVLDASKQQAQAAVSAANAAVESASAQILTSQEALLEAQLMGNDEAAAQAQQSIQLAQEAFDNTQTQAQAVKQIAAIVAQSDDAAQAAAAAAQASATSAVATANAATAVAVAQVTMAALSGNKDAVEAAQKQVAATQQTVELATQQQALAEKLVQTIAAAPETSIKVAVAASSAITDAADTVATTAKAQANVATQAASGDTASLVDAQAAAKQLEEISITVTTAVAQVIVAVESNDVSTVIKIAELAKDTAEFADETYKAVEEKLITAPEGSVGDEVLPDEQPSMSPSG